MFAASQEGHSGVVDLLVKAGADIHLADTKVHVRSFTCIDSSLTLSVAKNFWCSDTESMAMGAVW